MTVRVGLWIFTADLREPTRPTRINLPRLTGRVWDVMDLVTCGHRPALTVSVMR